MDYGDISRKYLMELIGKLDQKIWDQYKTYEDVGYFIVKWHEEDENYNSYDHWENFRIYYKDDTNQTINLKSTLHHMPPAIVIKIAIDLGIDTPGFLPAIPTFKNVLKDQNQSAYQNFERAVKNVCENPDEAVSLASSTLEGIIKTILAHDSFKNKSETIKNKPLTKLVTAIIKEFGFDDKTKCPIELITIAGQLRGIGTTIDDLRSDKSTAHGKAHDDYIIDDPLWASFIVNVSASLGLFLWEYFEKKYKPNLKPNKVKFEDVGDEPINLDDIPF